MVPRLLILICATAILAGCTAGAKTSNWVKPIYISKDDRLTEGTAEQIAVHNETWEKNNR